MLHANYCLLMPAQLRAQPSHNQVRCSEACAILKDFTLLEQICRRLIENTRTEKYEPTNNIPTSRTVRNSDCMCGAYVVDIGVLQQALQRAIEIFTTDGKVAPL